MQLEGSYLTDGPKIQGCLSTDIPCCMTHSRRCPCLSLVRTRIAEVDLLISTSRSTMNKVHLGNAWNRVSEVTIPEQ